MFYIDPLIDRMEAVVKSHALGNGGYARWLWQNAEGTRNLGSSEYGCADAANILYTIDRFPKGEDAAALCRAIQDMQNPETGLFHEPTHHAFHSTAHCTAALELFGTLPRYEMKALRPYCTREGLYALLDGLNWRGSPWNNAHLGAGIYVSTVLTGMVDLQWQNDYFDWLTRETDPDYGISRRGTIDGTAPVCHHLYGWFHYLFNVEYAHRPFPCADRAVDTCLDLWNGKKMGPAFGRYVGFSEIDWIYTLNRGLRHAPARFTEGKQALHDFAADYIPYLMSLDPETDEGMNDLHAFFGAVCAVTELQAALPGEFVSTKPLRLVLDRRPFI